MKHFTTLLLTLVLTATVVLGQSPNLSLADALSKCLQNNYDLEVARQDIQVAQRNNNFEQAGRMPTVSFRGTANNNRSFNQPASPFALPGTNRSNVLSGSLDAQWVIFNGGRVNITKERLSQLEVQSKADLSIAIENTLEAVTLAYYQAQLELENQKVLEKVLSLSNDRVEYVRLQRELGSATSFEVSQEETTFFADSTNLVNQELTLSNAFRQLNFLMAESNLNQTYTLTDGLDYQQEDYVYEQLLSQIKTDNNNLRKRFILNRLQEIDIDQQGLAFMPNFLVNAGYNGSKNWFRAGFPVTVTPSLPDPLPAGSMTWEEYRNFNESIASSRFIETQTNSGYSYGPYVNFTLTIPIYNGRQNVRAVQNARVEFEKSKIQTQKLELELSRDLYQSLDQYNNRIKVASLSRKSKEAAELNLNLSRDRLQTGVINSFDYRQVQVQYLNAAQNELRAKYNVILSQVSLLKLTGKLVSEASGK